MKANQTPRANLNPEVFREFKEHATVINLLVARLGNDSALPEYADDTAAAAGGLPLYDFYRTGSAVKQRVA